MPGIHAFPSPIAPSRERDPPQTARPQALARRKRALLRLTRRQGGVRIALREAGACDRLDALAELNEDGLLRWGGLVRTSDGRAEAIYSI